MSHKKRIAFWLEGAEKAFQTAEDLNKLKHFDFCLFFCHLALEKLLKSLLMKETEEMPPRIHDLARLAEMINLPLNKEQIINLRMITTFNVAGRYQEEKFNLYKLATAIYTKKYLAITKNLFLWLKEFHKK